MKPSPLEQTRGAFVRAFTVIGVFSLCTGLLMLAGPLYMLQIYDRVISTGHVDTLVALSVMIAVALLVYALLEGMRTLVAQRVGMWLDRRLSGPALAGGVGRALVDSGAGAQGLRDLGTIRGYLGSPSIFPLFDAPLAPAFLLILYLMHPLLGIVATVGAVVLFGFALLNEVLTRKWVRRASGASQRTFGNADAAVRNADVIMAMGMLPNLARRMEESAERWRGLQMTAGDRSGMFGAAAKGTRLLLQSAILGFGAWLVIREAITPGMMIAASIIMSRALAPVEQAIGAWQGLVNAQAAWERLKEVLTWCPPESAGTRLPEPAGQLVVENLVYQPPGTDEPILKGVSFAVEPGTAIGVIGPTGSGKTTLARLIIGTIAAQRGSVRLDGADMARWDPRDRGRHVGYLPQDIELFDGTVKENVARLGEAEDEEVVTAAQLAGVHEMILSLPDGYETRIGTGGARLSGGQRQRLALARAVFGRPRLLVLDEPNASLDAAGEVALGRTITSLKLAGHTILIIAHKPSLLDVVDRILVLRDGRVADFGDRDEIMAKYRLAGAPQEQSVQARRPVPVEVEG